MTMFRFHANTVLDHTLYDSLTLHEPVLLVHEGWLNPHIGYLFDQPLYSHAAAEMSDELIEKV